METNLPQGWIECSLGEILTAKKGKKPASVINEPKAGYAPYILIDEMEGKLVRAYTNDPKVLIIDSDVRLETCILRVLNHQWYQHHKGQKYLAKFNKNT